MDPFSSLQDAIATFEGYGKPNTIATRQNNPGDLTYGPFAQSQGATGSGSGNIAIFPNSDTGMTALGALIQHYADNGYNIGQLINAWNPPNAPGNSPANTQNYLDYVTSKTGTTPSSPIPSDSGSFADTYSGLMGGAFSALFGGAKTGTVSGAVSGGVKGATEAPSFSFGRIVAIAVGLIAIAGSVYLFKSSDIPIGALAA